MTGPDPFKPIQYGVQYTNKHGKRIHLGNWDNRGPAYDLQQDQIDKHQQGTVFAEDVKIVTRMITKWEDEA